MLSLFARDRFGTPQLIAIAFLLAFMAQCAWALARTPLSDAERAYVREGSARWSGTGASREGPRLVALAAGAGHALGSALDELAGSGHTCALWGARLPFLGVAVLLGGSLWYVARRLYGNTGGYIVLALYCFSPGFVWRGALVNAEIVAVWGAFGTVFAGIAGAHTLYAPLTWKQRAPRAVLLGTAIGLAIGAAPQTLVVLPLTFAFMMYLVPGRRAAALGVFAAALLAGIFLLLASFRFDIAEAAHHLGAFRMMFFDAAGRAHAAVGGWPSPELPPPLALLFAIALAAYASWRRARYFGNTAPLLVASAFVALGMAASRSAFLEWLVWALPFLYVFIAGVFADLLETRRRGLVLGALAVLLVAHAAWG